MLVTLKINKVIRSEQGSIVLCITRVFFPLISLDVQGALELSISPRTCFVSPPVFALVGRMWPTGLMIPSCVGVVLLLKLTQPDPFLLFYFVDFVLFLLQYTVVKDLDFPLS